MGVGTWKFGQSGRPSAADAPLVAEGAEVVRILSSACRLAAPATIVAPDAGRILRGRMAGLTSELVRLDLLEEVGEVSPRTTCCVSFIQGGRARLFIAAAREYLSGDGTRFARLGIEIPGIIAGTEARMAFRVPLEDGTGLATRLSDGTASWSVRARDISMSGILVQLRPGHDPGWPIGKQLMIELRLEEESVDLVAQVCRRVDGSYGMVFPQAVRDRGFAPPEGLWRIVKALDRAWLAGRQTLAT